MAHSPQAKPLFKIPPGYQQDEVEEKETSAHSRSAVLPVLHKMLSLDFGYNEKSRKIKIKSP